MCSATTLDLAIDPDLTAVRAALADISDTELAALIVATYDSPQFAPGFLAWVEHTLSGDAYQLYQMTNNPRLPTFGRVCLPTTQSRDDEERPLQNEG
jgi:hypothetical protein